MLPLLPALLLLILRGPSAIERAHVAGLSSKEAISWRSIQRAIDESPRCQERQAQLANRTVRSLVALGCNPAFSRTVAELLSYLPLDTESEPKGASAVADSETRASLPVFAQVSECAGFLKAQRSRDGPIVL